MSNQDLEKLGEVKDACYDLDLYMDDLWDDVVRDDQFTEKYNLINDELGKISDWYTESKQNLKYVVDWMTVYNHQRDEVIDKLKTLKRSLKFLKNDIETKKAPRVPIS
jgi:predicted nuclease with TOPRIM domain